MRNKIFITFILSVCHVIVLAQTTVNLKSAESLPLDTDLLHGVLDNGFSYYIRKTQSGSKQVHLQLSVKAGMMQEDDDQQDNAHLLEHIGMKGSKNFPESFNKYLAQFSLPDGVANATTGWDGTFYTMNLPVNKSEIINTGLLLLRGVAGDLLIREEDVQIEGQAVITEITGSPTLILKQMDSIDPKLLGKSQYAKRGITGNRLYSTKSFNRASLVRFYNDWYRPELQAIIIVGDIDTDAMLRFVKQTFGDLKKREQVRPWVQYDVFVPGENRLITLCDKEIKAVTLKIYHKHASSYKTQDDLKKILVGRIYNLIAGDYFSNLSNTYNSPINIASHSFQQQGLIGFERISSMNTILRIDSFKEIKPALEKIGGIWTRISRKGFEQNELSNARIELLQMLDKPDSSIAALYNECSQHFIYGAPCMNPVFKSTLEKKICNDISLQDLNEFAREMITENNRDIVIEAPENMKSKIPSLSDMEKWIASAPVMSMSLENSPRNFKPVGVLGKGSKKEVKELMDVNATQVLLKNGMKIILKPVPDHSGNGMLKMIALSKKGAKAFPDKYFGEAKYAAEIILHSGLANMDKFQFNRYLEKESLSISPFIGDYESTVRGSVAKAQGIKSFENLVLLMQQYMMEPVKKIAAFEDWKKTRKRMNNEFSDDMLWSNEITKAVDGNYMVIPSEGVDLLDYEAVCSAYKEIFASVSDFNVVLTGDFKKEEVLPILERYLGGLPATKSKAFSYSRVQPKMPMSKILYSEATESPKVQLRYLYQGKTDPIKIYFMNWLLQQRMTERLREQEKGVYTVAASWHPAINDLQQCVITFVGNKTAVDRHILAAKDEITKLRTSLVSKDLIDTFIVFANNWYSEYKGSNNYWYDVLSEEYFHGENVYEKMNFDELVKKLTPEDIRAAAQEYFIDQNYMQVILMPASSKDSNAQR